MRNNKAPSRISRSRPGGRPAGLPGCRRAASESVAGGASGAGGGRRGAPPGCADRQAGRGENYGNQGNGAPGPVRKCRSAACATSGARPAAARRPRTRELEMVSIPGAMTPTEIVQAAQWGASVVKVFPAGNLGPDYIKAVRGPLDHIPLCAGSASLRFSGA